MSDAEQELLKQIEASMDVKSGSSAKAQLVTTPKDYDEYLYNRFKEHDKFTGVKGQRKIEVVAFRTLGPLDSSVQNKTFEEAMPLTFEFTGDDEDNEEILAYLREQQKEIAEVADTITGLYKLKEQYNGLVVNNTVYNVH